TQVLTPAYASPEQVEGAPLTTAADVWALGVVLYELLAGQRPHQALDGHRLGEAILSGAIEPPSRRARRGVAGAGSAQDATPRLPPVRIPADVDAIVLKALRRDPQARYASVAAMAEDIRRFLQHRPVLARRGHALYRLGRLVRRQRWVIAAGVGVIAVAAGFAVQRERQLEQVLAERNKAEAVSEFMRELFAKASPDAGQDGDRITVREVLDASTVALEHRKDLDPATRTSLRLSIADAYSALGMESSALPLFEVTLRDLRERGASIDDMADVITEISTAHQMSGKNQVALSVARNGMSLFPENEKKPLAWMRLRERELINLSLMGADTPEESLEGYSTLIPLIESERATDSGTAANLLGNVWFGISQAHNRLNQNEAAIEAMANAMKITSESGLSAKNRLQYAQRHATLVMEKNPAEGVRLLHEIDDRHVRLFGEISGSRATLLNQIAVGYGRLQKREEQVKWQAKSVDMARQALGTDNRLFLQMATNQAVTLNRMGQHAAAMEAIESVLPGLRKLQAPGVDTVNLAFALSTRGDILLDSGASPETALDSFEQAKRLLGDTTGEFIVVQYNLTRGLIRTHMSLKDPNAAQAIIDDFDDLLDRDGFPTDSRWRDSAAKLRDLIPAK
ncbi:tetratricopeptide repeat-containing protein kinase family protein, partial [Xanthomonas sp. XNM01]|uniref:tetratricopeptide repeat-containing protein kinase family protein n=1 Tax=Xanthomonas sp. XNM01 TaxID=2769289 RepID=UPI00177FE1A2